MQKKSKTLLNLIIAAAIFVILKLLLPTDSGLTPQGANVIAIFIATIYLWLTEGVGWTSLLSLAGLAMSGIATPTNIWQISWGNYIIIFSITVMMINSAVEECGLAKHFALWFITRRAVKNKPYLFIAFFLLADMILSFFMGLIAITAIFMALAESICRDLGYTKDDKFTRVLYLGILWISVVGFGATPIGHSVPLTVMGLIEASTGQAVPVLKYMMVGVPFAIIFFIIMMLVFKFVIKPDCSKFVNYDIEAQRAEMKPITKEGKIVAAIFIGVIICWVFPDLGKYFAPAVASYISKLSVVVPSLLAVVLLCVIKVDNKPLMSLGRALTKVSWISVVFMATVNAVGSCIQMQSGGISTFLQNLCAPLATSVPAGAIALVAMLLVLVITNFISCTVAATMIYSAFIPVLLAMPGNTVSIMGLGVMIAILADTAFMTPSANPASPLIFGSGNITMRDGMVYGGLMMVASYIVCLVAIWPLAQVVF